jgi:ribosomal protein S18 acetylase RimI-like enzyme
MSIAIRVARAGDATAIRELVRAAYAHYIPRMGREPAPMTADYAALVGAGQVVVADEGDIVLGVMVSYPQGDHLHVENVAVLPAAQGRSVGRALMAEAERQCRLAGCSAIELYTNAVMEENFSFYTALGFRITGKRIEDGYNRVYFRKDLNPKA